MHADQAEDGARSPAIQTGREAFNAHSSAKLEPGPSKPEAGGNSASA